MKEQAPAHRGRLRTTPLRGWSQRFLHLAALIAGWALFVWSWMEVLGRPADTQALRWLIIGSLVVLPTVTVAWVLHNIGIHRRKGPRRGVPAADESYRQDWNGRTIDADFGRLKAARVVIVDLRDDRKLYRTSDDAILEFRLLAPARAEAETR